MSPPLRSRMAAQASIVEKVQSIHIYGVPACGHGYIVCTKGGRLLGNGEPRQEWSATTALFTAADALVRDNPRAARSPVEVHYDFDAGPRMALVDRLDRMPYFGELMWQVGPVYVIKMPSEHTKGEQK